MEVDEETTEEISKTEISKTEIFKQEDSQIEDSEIVVPKETFGTQTNDLPQTTRTTKITKRKSKTKVHTDQQSMSLKLDDQRKFLNRESTTKNGTNPLIVQTNEATTQKTSTMSTRKHMTHAMNTKTWTGNTANSSTRTATRII